MSNEGGAGSAHLPLETHQQCDLVLCMPYLGFHIALLQELVDNSNAVLLHDALLPSVFAGMLNFVGEGEQQEFCGSRISYCVKWTLQRGLSVVLCCHPFQDCNICDACA